MLTAVKTLGLIGGTTWHSTIEYYRAINEGVHARLGGSSSARLILYSVNFEELKPPTDPAGWSRVAVELTSIARRLETAGAECIVLCANTPHIVADDVGRAIGIPILHIADPLGAAIVASGLRTVGLLGTRPTMTTVVPDERSRAFVHSSIFEELGQGIFTASTKARYLAIIDELAEGGARGVILGCTELPLLIKPEDCRLPVFDTTALHAAAAVQFALSG
jgi:aspartate racemase